MHKLNHEAGVSKVTWNLKYISLPDLPQLLGRRGTEMDVKSQEKFSKRNSNQRTGSLIKYTVGLLLIISGLFFFASALHAQEKEDEILNFDLETLIDGRRRRIFRKSG